MPAAVGRTRHAPAWPGWHPKAARPVRPSRPCAHAGCCPLRPGCEAQCGRRRRAISVRQQVRSALGAAPPEAASPPWRAAAAAAAQLGASWARTCASAALLTASGSACGPCPGNGSVSVSVTLSVTGPCCCTALHLSRAPLASRPCDEGTRAAPSQRSAPFPCRAVAEQQRSASSVPVLLPAQRSPLGSRPARLVVGHLAAERTGAATSPWTRRTRTSRCGRSSGCVQRPVLRAVC